MSVELANGDASADASSPQAAAFGGDGGDRSWLDAIASFRFPVRLLSGAKSADAGEDEQMRALEGLGIPRRPVEGAAHFIPSEVPEALAETLRSVTEP